jgi:nifR3 family TIM-barrel protein
MNPWIKSSHPLWVLAPMEEVTDTVFRRVIQKTGKPDILYTEFTSTDGMQHQQGRERVIHRLQYTEQERPLIAQIWGKDPEHYYAVAKDIVELGFDGIDINMGCPVKKIIKQGSCSALIKTSALASEIIKAVQEGVKGKIPVSVKTRIGFDSIVTEEWCGHLLSHKLAALIVHGRTTKEQSKVPCHWDEIAKVPALRNNLSPETLIIGNGDIMSHAQGLQLAEETGVDGLMVGRGIFHNPWMFNKEYHELDGILLKGDTPVSNLEKLTLGLYHLDLWIETYCKTDLNPNHYNTMKKFFKIYVSGFDGASQLRSELMQTKSPQEAKALLVNSLK